MYDITPPLVQGEAISGTDMVDYPIRGDQRPRYDSLPPLVQGVVISGTGMVVYPLWYRERR